MVICKKCGGIAYYDSYFGGNVCTRCGYAEKPKPVNGDDVRQMTNEELAAWKAGSPCPPGAAVVCHPTEDISCESCWLIWLMEEAQQEKEDQV